MPKYTFEVKFDGLDLDSHSIGTIVKHLVKELNTSVALLVDISKKDLYVIKSAYTDDKVEYSFFVEEKNNKD